MATQPTTCRSSKVQKKGREVVSVFIPDLSCATRVTSAGNYVSVNIFFLLSYKGKISAMFLKATYTDDFASKKFGTDKQICSSQG